MKYPPDRPPGTLGALLGLWRGPRDPQKVPKILKNARNPENLTGGALLIDVFFGWDTENCEGGKFGSPPKIYHFFTKISRGPLPDHAGPSPALPGGPGPSPGGSWGVLGGPGGPRDPSTRFSVIGASPPNLLSPFEETSLGFYRRLLFLLDEVINYYIVIYRR